MTPDTNAICLHRSYEGTCGARVRAVLGHRRPDVAYVGVEPFFYACALYEGRRLHRHQGYAAWDRGDAIFPAKADLGFTAEPYRIRGKAALEDRRLRAQEYTRRPEAAYVVPPDRRAPRTVQRRLA